MRVHLLHRQAAYRDGAQATVSSMFLDADLKVSVVIVTRERKDDLRGLLLGLRRQTLPAYETIVVDNASTDATWELLSKEFPEVHAIRTETNLGCPGGRNAGLRAARGDIAVCLDDDLVVSNDVLALFADPFARDERLAVGYGRVVNYYTEAPERWAFSRFGRPDRPCYTYTFPGGAAAVRLRALRQVGHYPDDFMRQCEELDLGYRLLEQGWRIMYLPDVTCRHKRSPKARLPSDMAYYHTRNELWTCWRNLPWPEVLLYTVWKSVYLPVCYARRGLVSASMRGLLSAFRHLPANLARRLPVRRQTLRLAAALKSRLVTSLGDYRQVERESS